MKSLRRALSLFNAFLRELSDENAYARHLKSTGRTHCGETWRAYIDGRHKRKFKNAKCC